MRNGLLTEEELKVLEESSKRIRNARLKKTELKGRNYFVVEYFDRVMYRTKKDCFGKIEDGLFCYKFYKEHRKNGIMNLRFYKEYCKEDIKELIKDIL